MRSPMKLTAVLMVSALSARAVAAQSPTVGAVGQTDQRHLLRCAGRPADPHPPASRDPRSRQGGGRFRRTSASRRHGAASTGCTRTRPTASFTSRRRRIAPSRSATSSRCGDSRSARREAAPAKGEGRRSRCGSTASRTRAIRRRSSSTAHTDIVIEAGPPFSRSRRSSPTGERCRLRLSGRYVCRGSDHVVESQLLSTTSRIGAPSSSMNASRT